MRRPKPLPNDTDFRYLQFIRGFMPMVLPLVFDDSISMLEMIERIKYKMNELIKNNNTIPDLIRTLLEEMLNSDTFGEIIADYVNSIYLNVTVPPVGIPAAKGDGTTDDTAAIQGTIDWAAEQGGGLVHVPKGTYMINPITLKDNVSLIGEDRYLTRFVLLGGATTDMFTAINLKNVTIANFTCDGNFTVQNKYLKAFDISGSAWHIHDIIFDNFYSGANFQTLAGHVQIERLLFFLCTESHMVISGEGEITMYDCDFYNLNEEFGKTSLTIDTNHGDYRFNMWGPAETPLNLGGRFNQVSCEIRHSAYENQPMLGGDNNNVEIFHTLKDYEYSGTYQVSSKDINLYADNLVSLVADTFSIDLESDLSVTTGKNVTANVGEDLSNTVMGNMTTNVSGTTTQHTKGNEFHISDSNYSESVGGVRVETTSGNTTRVYQGEVSENFSGIYTGNFQDHRDITVAKNNRLDVNGDNTLLVTGDETENFNKNKNTTVDGNSNLLIKGTSQTEMQDGNLTIVTGDNSISVSGRQSETYALNQDVHVMGNRNVYVEGNVVSSAANYQTTTTGDFKVAAKNIIATATGATKFNTTSLEEAISGNEVKSVGGTSNTTYTGNASETYNTNHTITVSGKETQNFLGGYELTSPEDILIHSDKNIRMDANESIWDNAPSINMVATTNASVTSPTVDINAADFIEVSAGTLQEVYNGSATTVANSISTTSNTNFDIEAKGNAALHGDNVNINAADNVGVEGKTLNLNGNDSIDLSSTDINTFSTGDTVIHADKEAKLDSSSTVTVSGVDVNRTATGAISDRGLNYNLNANGANAHVSSYNINASQNVSVTADTYEQNTTTSKRTATNITDTADSKTGTYKSVQTTVTGNVDQEVTGTVESKVGENLNVEVSGDHTFSAESSMETYSLSKDIGAEDIVLRSNNPLTYKTPVDMGQGFKGVPFKDYSGTEYMVLTNAGVLPQPPPTQYPPINVLEYGLKNDGTTPNDAAYAALPRKDCLIFPTGTYLFSNDLDINADVYGYDSHIKAPNIIGHGNFYSMVFEPSNTFTVTRRSRFVNCSFLDGLPAITASKVGLNFFSCLFNVDRCIDFDGCFINAYGCDFIGKTLDATFILNESLTSNATSNVTINGGNCSSMQLMGNIRHRSNYTISDIIVTYQSQYSKTWIYLQRNVYEYKDYRLILRCITFNTNSNPYFMHLKDEYVVADIRVENIEYTCTATRPNFIRIENTLNLGIGNLYVEGVLNVSQATEPCLHFEVSENGSITNIRLALIVNNQTYANSGNILSITGNPDRVRVTFFQEIYTSSFFGFVSASGNLVSWNTKTNIVKSGTGVYHIQFPLYLPHDMTTLTPSSLTPVIITNANNTATSTYRDYEVRCFNLAGNPVDCAFTYEIKGRQFYSSIATGIDEQ